MNVNTTQQSYTNYQTQTNNATSKTESADNFLSMLQGVESTKSESTNATETTQNKFDEKYKLGLDRYNALQSNDKNWFEDSVFEKDQNAKNEFVEYLSDLTTKDYMDLSTKLWMSFGSGLIEDKNGDIVSGGHDKNPANEFMTVESTKNYFKNEIYKLEEGARRFGGDPSEMIDLLSDVLNFFKDYQSKEQENLYQALGNR